jgi:hypothetical protein
VNKIAVYEIKKANTAIMIKTLKIFSSQILKLFLQYKFNTIILSMDAANISTN